MFVELSLWGSFSTLVGSLLSKVCPSTVARHNPDLSCAACIVCWSRSWSCVCYPAQFMGAVVCMHSHKLLLHTPIHPARTGCMLAKHTSDHWDPYADSGPYDCSLMLLCRSMVAAYELLQAGIGNSISVLKGGYTEWCNGGRYTCCQMLNLSRNQAHSTVLYFSI